MRPTIFTTADGSHSLRTPDRGIAYHSTHGALAESRHIFIEAGLRPLLREGRTSVHVLEMGFGTGLNALLTWNEARQYPDVAFEYIAYERYPIDGPTAASLNYDRLLSMGEGRLGRLHAADWEERQRLSDNFTLTKHAADFLAAAPASPADLLYYDAFSPADQPELWDPAAMRRCAGLLRPGGVLVTYCARGQFKRNLRAAGFRVEALPGPVGKREITRAYLVDLPQLPV